MYLLLKYVGGKVNAIARLPHTLYIKYKSRTYKQDNDTIAFSKVANLNQPHCALGNYMLSTTPIQLLYSPILYASLSSAQQDNTLLLSLFL